MKIEDSSQIINHLASVLNSNIGNKITTELANGILFGFDQFAKGNLIKEETVEETPKSV